MNQCRAMINGYIFDLDGVIVDTAKYHYEAWNRLANTFGYGITLEQNENLKGVSRMESLDYILSLGANTVADSEKIKLAELKNKWYVELISDLQISDILPGALELLQELKAANLKVSLGSASKNSERILRGLDIIHLFDEIIDGNKTTKSKPHPQVFLMGAESLGLPPGECVVFEDSVKGVQAANTGGFASIGVGASDILHEADVVVPDLDGLTVAKINNLLAAKATV